MQRATRGRNGNASRKADHERPSIRNDWAGIALEIETKKTLTRRGRLMEGRWEVQKWFLSDPIVIIAYQNYHLSRSMLGKVQLHPMVAMNYECLGLSQSAGCAAMALSAAGLCSRVLSQPSIESRSIDVSDITYDSTFVGLGAFDRARLRKYIQGIIIDIRIPGMLKVYLGTQPGKYKGLCGH